ncbi:MAG: carbohydrate-binding domain-containing protein [Candidatus Uhrbacteria bacterium]
MTRTDLLVDISSTVSKDDPYDRVCFAIPNAEQYSIETKQLLNTTITNPTFATQNIKDLPQITNKNIALTSLVFADGEQNNYQIYTPLEFGKESYLGIWTNAQASFEMPTDGYLHVVARATQANGEWPILHLTQNQQDTPLVINTNAASVYTVKLSSGTVQLAYSNDAKNTSEDRNVYIQNIYVDNSPTQLMSASSYFTRENNDICFENSLAGTTRGSFLFSPITSNTQHPSASQDAIKFLEESGEIQEE